jgi:hypothetical protein
VGDVLPYGSDCADDLVSGDERILADSPFVIEYAQIAVTNPAVANVNFNLVMLESIREIVLERIETSAGLVGGVGMYGRHGLSPVAVG